MSIEETLKKLARDIEPQRTIYLADDPRRSSYPVGNIRQLIGKPLKVFAVNDKGFYLCLAPDGSMADVHQEDIKK
jgi:hypothetical protein